MPRICGDRFGVVGVGSSAASGSIGRVEIDRCLRGMYAFSEWPGIFIDISDDPVHGDDERTVRLCRTNNNECCVRSGACRCAAVGVAR